LTAIFIPIFCKKIGAKKINLVQKIKLFGGKMQKFWCEIKLVEIKIGGKNIVKSEKFCKPFSEKLANYNDSY